MSYLLAFLGFAALIILHEAGHFAVAKAVGMRVERFSLFFGPLLWKVRRGETEYGIGPIPLGGYVKITGMNPHEDIPPDVIPRAYYNQPPWKRIVVILAGPAVNLVLAFAILTGIYFSQGVADLSRNEITNTVSQPASTYLKPGDQIVALDGHRRPTVNEIEQLISKHRCPGVQRQGCVAAAPVQAVVLRKGHLLSLSIYPRYDQGAKAMRIGFDIEEGTRSVGLVGAAHEGISQTWYWTRRTVGIVGRLFEPKERKQLHGVVGGFTVTQEEFGFSATDALGTLALISLSLAVVNLFPFLPLDGGHVFWAVAEKLRRRRIPFEVMERAGVVGFALIALVFVIGLSNDISTLTGSGFNVH